jgi:hypothetical protein
MKININMSHISIDTGLGWLAKLRRKKCHKAYYVNATQIDSWVAKSVGRGLKVHLTVYALSRAAQDVSRNLSSIH